MPSSTASEIVLSIVPPGEALDVAAATRGRATRTGARPIGRRSERDRASDDGGGRRAPRERGAERRRRLDLRAAAARAPGRRSSTSRGRAPRRLRAWRRRGSSSASSASRSGRPRRSRCRPPRSTRARRRSWRRRSASARANGVLELVLDDLRRNYPELVDDAPRMLQSIAAKSGRYVAEMQEIAVQPGERRADARSLHRARRPSSTAQPRREARRLAHRSRSTRARALEDVLASIERRR